MSDRITGGKLYDQGGYGCVFIPPLTCIPGSEVGETGQNGVLEIDKLLMASEADIEFSISEMIRRIPLWRNYYLISTSMCTPAPREQQNEPDLASCKALQGEDFEDFRLIRMPFGGRPLSQVSIRFSGKVMYDFIVHFLESVALLQLFGVVHRDLHQGNILVDDANVPRIIDFNLSINVRNKVNGSDIRHKVSMGLFHESPDSCLVNAVAQGEDGFTVIDRFINERHSLRKVQAILGITKDEMREQLSTFYRKSKSAQEGNYTKWFETYWPTIDSWAVGMNIVYLITDNMLWKGFRDSTYMSYEKRLMGVTRDMLNMNPMKRIDCVQALARLDADNYIIRKYAKKWLEKRPVV